ncbi:DNA ligase D [Rhizobium sp. L1K21]|uniref:DNA ligase D n=1 Tax=Rhizobium sp. L1K21 TaxID=2954933 RepID=UPI0020939111|nr:DNA ligase D [Rhizobium sp. L1K21]MCO6187524.1 DNA ligase D [Rhizobium sp. L1K21]
MALETYNSKRRFDRTAEPRGEKAKGKGSLFIVQKHHARRLHYDFRLEMDGVLKSWAVTKGPSLDPEDKRLAVHVEDHPLSYAEFEGEIPKGEYGAGKVILWDRGEWRPIGDAAKGYRKGKLDFELSGEKLKGRWHLVRMKGKPEEKRENWLLIKGDDENAVHDRGDRILERTESVKKDKKRKAGSDFPVGAKVASMPDFVDPCLAVLKKQPPKGEKWLHEIKFDGYRLQARLEDGVVALLTRSGHDWTDKFGSALKKAFAALPARQLIIDGEVVVEGTSGASDFSALQQDLSEGRDDRFVLYAFDLLYLDGHDLRNVPLLARKEKLQGLLKAAKPTVRYSEHFDEAGGLVLEHACRLSLEGVISKDGKSRYVSGRKGQWVKSKCSHRQEFVIGGYAPSSTSDQAIGSLALGIFENGKLRHVGRVGTGFTRAASERLFDRLAPLSREENPFSENLSANARRDLVYVEPQLVAEVEFRAWSADGNLRHASFRGLREDKPAEAVCREDAQPDQPSAPQSNVKLSHPDRLYWPGAGVTKEGLADYYAQVWRFMAPFVIDRPLALLRCPEGIEGPRFFQKHTWRGANRHIDKVADPKDRGGKPLLRILDFDGMMALVQSGVLEIHPWGANTKAWEKPDMITMDLDPGEDVPWSDVIAAAKVLKQRFEALGLVPFVKTSGGKGLHVVVPLKPKANWSSVKAFSKKMATDMAKDEPDLYVAVSTKAKRNGRIFIDYLRNGRGNTAIAAYSTRARPGAAVSMPLAWEELSADIGPDYFTVENAPARLMNLRNDPWETFFSSARPLPTK